MFVAFIIVVIIAAALALSSVRKTQTQQPQKGTIPSVKDGKKIVRVFGTVWIDDPMQLAMQQTGEDPIRSK